MTNPLETGVVGQVPAAAQPEQVSVHPASFIEKSTKYLRNATIAGLAVLAASAVLAEVADTSESSSAASSTLTTIYPAYDISQITYPEFFVGYARDDMGPFGGIEAWANVEGIAQKELLYRPPYPIRSEVREDELGKYIYVYMLDNDGKEVDFEFNHLTVGVKGLEPCTNTGGDDQTFEERFTFPDCPAADDPEWTGAISARASDGGAWWKNQGIASEAYRASDIQIHGDYCMGKLLGTNNPLDENQLASTTPNPELAADRWREIVFTNFRDQFTSGYNIPAWDSHGLPTVRFRRTKLVIEEILKLNGKEVFDDPAKAAQIMYGYSQIGDYIGGRNDGKQDSLDLGPSYGEQLETAKEGSSHIKLDDLELKPTPATSKINWYTCYVPYILSQEASDNFQGILTQASRVGGDYGPPLEYIDGTVGSAEDLDRRLTIIAGGKVDSQVGHS